MINELKKDMPFDEYINLDACHKSALKHVDTAKHLAHFTQKPLDSDALRFGKIFHAWLLEPDSVADIEVYTEQEWIPKADHPEGISINEQKAKWKEGREMYFANDGEKQSIKSMVQSVMDNPLAQKFLTGEGIAEASLTWTDPRTGLPCKTRLDWLRDDGIIVEIKTTADPSPEGFGRQIYSLDYQVGAWFNREGYKACFGKDIKSFIFIAVGKSEPHAVGVYMMNAHDFDGGEIKGTQQMLRYKAIKEGGLLDYNHAEDGEYHVMPVQTPNWELKLIDDVMGEIDAPMESEL